MSDWVHLQAHSGEQLMQLHHFSIVKQQPSGNVTFEITVKEFAVPPPGQRLRFYAEADKPVNQNIAAVCALRLGVLTIFGSGGLRAADPAVSL